MLLRTILIATICLSPVPPPAAPAKVAGTWNVSLEIGSITGHPVLELEQDGEKVTGSYRGHYGLSRLEGAVKEKEITFSVTINAEGQKTAGYFAGTVEGDQMRGSVEFEGAGEGTWSATRAPAKGKEPRQEAP